VKHPPEDTSKASTNDYLQSLTDEQLISSAEFSGNPIMWELAERYQILLSQVKCDKNDS
jgi:hypothetical protein